MPATADTAAASGRELVLARPIDASRAKDTDQLAALVAKP